MKKLLATSLLLLSCTSLAYDIQKNLPVNYDKVKANGKPVALLGNQIEVGQQAPDFRVVDDKFKIKTKHDFAGKPLLISAVTSLDTGVCSLQTKRFNDAMELLPQDVEVITISADLPFAQKRFCQAENIERIQTYSDSVWRDFAMNYGLLIKDMGLLARAVFVIGPDNEVVYKEIVSELSEQPDYDAALSVLVSISEQNPNDSESQSATEALEELTTETTNETTNN